MNAIVLLAIVAVSAVKAADNPFPTSINGNIGLVGSGYGDVYGGKIKEGVWGAGGRIGGNLGLVGGLGLGRRKREAALNGASATAGAIASGPDSFSMAGAAAGAGMLSFGAQPVAPAATAAPPAATAAPPAKSCGKRRRRSVPVESAIKNETVTKVVPTVVPSVVPTVVSSSIYPFPVYPMVVFPDTGFQMPPIPNGMHGVSARGKFKFEGTATVDENGELQIIGTKFTDGNTTYF